MPRIHAPLWLELLRTPMAAPETTTLRRMRFTWQALCGSSALLAGFFEPLHDTVGPLAPMLVAVLLLATGLYTFLYLARKQAADAAFIARAGEQE